MDYQMCNHTRNDCDFLCPKKGFIFLIVLNDKELNHKAEKGLHLQSDRKVFYIVCHDGISKGK